MKALVTGASRGIGRAIAGALLGEGAAVALAVRDEASVLELLKMPHAVALAADLRDPVETEALVARAAGALGGLDVLVNCAGVVHYRAFEAVTRPELLEQLEVDFVAPFVLSQRAASHMRAAGGGVIVNVASTLAFSPAPLTAAYAAAKAALISLTRSLALELAKSGVRVNAVAPGVIDTDMVRVLRADGETVAGLGGDPVPPRPPADAEQAQRIEAQLDALRALHPLGRLGTPQDVVDAVLYLIGAKFVTGSVLVADGGLSLGSTQM